MTKRFEQLREQMTPERRERNEAEADNIMTARIQCPRYRQGQQCSGTLQFLAGQMTLLGTIEGVDGNEFFEVYCCDTCRGQVSRSYRWEPIAVDLPVDEEGDITS